MAGDLDPVAAQFPAVPPARGHYESFYVKACAPGGGRAIWIRYTVHKRPGHAPTGSLWCTLFDHDAAGPRALKETLPAPQPLAGGGIRIGGSRLTLDHIEGSASAAGRSAAWDLRIEGGEEPMAHLPARWTYRAPVPRTKVVTVRPAARVGGRVAIDNAQVAVDAWDGVMNHNWGSEHAERANSTSGAAKCSERLAISSGCYGLRRGRKHPRRGARNDGGPAHRLRRAASPCGVIRTRGCSRAAGT